MPEYTNNNLMGSIIKDLHTRKARIAKASRKTKAQEEMTEESNPAAEILDKTYEALSEGDHEAACDALKELAHHLDVADEVSFDTEISSGPGESEFEEKGEAEEPMEDESDDSMESDEDSFGPVVRDQDED